MSDEQRTPGGSPVFRYGEPRAWRFPIEQATSLQDIQDHLEAFLGPMHGDVLHEVISDQVHIDVLVFPPNEERPFWTLVTSGMSDLPMTTPEGLADAEQYQRAEVVISLPGDWISKNGVGAYQIVEFQTDKCWWPINWLKFMARFPHAYGTGSGTVTQCLTAIRRNQSVQVQR